MGSGGESHARVVPSLGVKDADMVAIWIYILNIQAGYEDLLTRRERNLNIQYGHAAEAAYGNQVKSIVRSWSEAVDMETGRGLDRTRKTCRLYVGYGERRRC